MSSRFFLIALGPLLGLLLLEGGLRLYTLAVPPIEPLIPDARVVTRPSPAYPGHDARGWRNTVALAQADVVAFGDSQTYGFNATTAEAWPQRVAVRLRRSVYQMANGGYGPAHYLPLLDEALALRPKVILAAYYFGNDDYDAYDLVYRIGENARRSSDPVLDDLATTAPDMRAAIADAEGSNPLALRIDHLWCSGPRLPGQNPDRLLREFIKSPREKLEQQMATSTPLTRRIVSQFKRHSLVFREVWPRLQPLLISVLGDNGSPLCVHYREGAVRTVFSAAYRFVLLDDTDPRMVEGERIALLVFKQMAERCRRAGIQFYITLLPTKETAFRARAEASLREVPIMVDLWQAEARARSRAMTFFARESLKTIDTLPALEAMIASGVNPYLESSESHPVASGYDAIAGAVADRLQQDDVLPSGE